MSQKLSLLFGVMLFAICGFVLAADGSIPAIDTSGFRDGTQHWRGLREDKRFMQPQPDQPSYAPGQVREIAANILLFQRTNGGWPHNYDMLAVLTEEQKAAVLATKDRADTSFDNRNVHSQVLYLARAYTAAREPTWRDACMRGFDFMLAAQYSNGGFPQLYPNPKDFHAHITLNDGVMTGILNVLQDAAEGAPHFAWLDEERRAKARAAVQRGIQCLLKCQIRVDGKLTGWCQQHDEKTYEARPARTFELASICPQDTVDVVRFLMRVKSPDKEIVETVNAAVQWLEQTKLSGIRVDKVAAPREEFKRYTADYDKVVVSDPQAPAIWARHYEIGTNRPMFTGRDGVKKYALSEIERERRTGSAWYGNWPRKFLEKEYPAWRARLRKAAK